MDVPITNISARITPPKKDPVALDVEYHAEIGPFPLLFSLFMNL